MQRRIGEPFSLGRTIQSWLTALGLKGRDSDRILQVSGTAIPVLPMFASEPWQNPRIFIGNTAVGVNNIIDPNKPPPGKLWAVQSAEVFHSDGVLTHLMEIFVRTTIVASIADCVVAQSQGPSQVGQNIRTFLATNRLILNEAQQFGFRANEAISAGAQLFYCFLAAEVDVGSYWIW